MRAMRAEQFSGYEGLTLVDLPKPVVSDGKVLLRMTAAGVTPLEHTILSGQFPLAKAPLARAAGEAHVIELSREGLADGVRRITHGRGVDVVVDGVGGPVTGLALQIRA